MNQVELSKYNIKAGAGQPLLVMAGLNVLEDEALALEVAAHLKAVCAGLNLPYIFKASFDKANRSSITSYRGPGLDKGLAILSAVKAAHNVPIITDIHEPAQAQAVAEVADVVQLPAFLVRQTDLVIAAAKAVSANNGWLNIKKAQFMAAWDCANVLDKAREAAPDVQMLLCERGNMYGYNNLVTDMLGIGEMQKLGVPVIMDATHAVQLPGADPRTVKNDKASASTGGRRDGVSVLARAAIASGADGIFLEFHPNPDAALCDAPSCLALSDAEALLSNLKSIHELVPHNE
ncbi:MAG: 3-deoxy-8-phosphooctulonate synthase [Alphaproteobacteria bacterium]|nr:3-deoxy-8-phosphooctulonate synthase [Alphaproteobacteria bacterium]MBE8220838.1 3-deoxy-8-phosphooctulonate synthase [Alphaproteobacteria bacterium]